MSRQQVKKKLKKLFYTLRDWDAELTAVMY